MRGSENVVARGVKAKLSADLLCFSTPLEKHETIPVVVKELERPFRKLLPSHPAV
jgi:hypothetical protein